MFLDDDDEYDNGDVSILLLFVYIITIFMPKFGTTSGINMTLMSSSALVTILHEPHFTHITRA